MYICCAMCHLPCHVDGVSSVIVHLATYVGKHIQIVCRYHYCLPHCLSGVSSEKRTNPFTATLQEYAKRAMRNIERHDHIKEAVSLLALKPPNVITVQAGAEPFEFTRLFHAWNRPIQRSLVGMPDGMHPCRYTMVTFCVDVWSSVLQNLHRTIPKLKHILDPLPPRPPVHERHLQAPFYIHKRETKIGVGEPVFSAGAAAVEQSTLALEPGTPDSLHSGPAKHPVLNDARFRDSAGSPMVSTEHSH